MVKVIYAPSIEARFGDNSVSVLVASINPWLILLVQPYLVNKLKDHNNVLVMGIGGLCVGMGYFLFGLSLSFVASAACLIALTFGEMLYSPISKNLAVGSFAPGGEGFAMGVWRGVFVGSGFIGPVMAGWIAERFGEVMVWDLCAIFGFICLLLAVLFKRSGFVLMSS